VDHTFGLGGAGLYQEADTTQLSRGRLSNNLSVASPENPRWEIGHHADDLARRDAVQSLVTALSQNRKQTVARDSNSTWPTLLSDPSTHRAPNSPGPEPTTRRRPSSPRNDGAEHGSLFTAPRSRPGPDRTGTSGVTSTGSAKPLPTASRTTPRPSSVRFPSASPVSTGGSQRQGSSSRPAAQRQEAPRASSTSYGSRHSGIGRRLSMPRGPTPLATCRP